AVAQIGRADFIDPKPSRRHSRGSGKSRHNQSQKVTKERYQYMKKSLSLVVCIALTAAFTGLCRAQSDAPYTEGPVWTVTMVKTKYGMTDDYLKGLAKTFKGTLDEAKKQNLITDYKVLLGDSSSQHDFDILLMVEQKNMASFDNAREKFDPIARKIEGSPDQQVATATKRVELREILGNKLMREITLK